MKVVHSPSPSSNPAKREKINLFEKDAPEEVAALCQQSALQESNKIEIGEGLWTGEHITKSV